MTNHIEKAKAALESCDGWPVNGTTDMALLAIANALVAIAEQGVESTLECIEDKMNALADNGAERSNNGVTRWHELFGTPERAARVIVALNNCRVICCEECAARGACKYDGCGDDYDALLELLRGEA